MQTGTVKFFRSEKGFGFIVPDEPNTEEPFFHIYDTRGRIELARGQRVRYDVRETDRGARAFGVEPIEAEENN